LNRRSVFLFLSIFFLFSVLGFAVSCNNDLLGLFASNDLDERLKERNNTRFLNARGWLSPSLGNEYSFIVVADTHIEDGNAFGLEKLTSVITANNVRIENTPIKFVVVLGDITQHGAAKDVDKFIEIADQLTVPCYPVIGNHDFYFGTWPVWRDRIGSTNYRINADTATLFILDSANSFFGKDQLDWLEREIRTATGRVFVFTHSPLFVTGPANMQQVTDTKERARIVSILRNKCDIMFMGHSHKHYYNETGNVKYVTIEDFVKNKTYCVVTVKPDGITYSFKKL